MEIYERKITIPYKIGCLFLPDRCPFCNSPVTPGEIYCKDCENKLKHIRYNTYAKGGFACVCTFPYTGHYKSAVKRYKFKNKKQYAYSIARMMADTIAKEYGNMEFDMITYVPIHRNRLKERGYDQCRLLAKNLSSILNIPYKNTLIKTRNSVPQHSLKKPKERENNVKDAYKIADKSIVEGKSILLLDDIITTGYTLGECAKTLQTCAPKTILCATFAISVVKNDLK